MTIWHSKTEIPCFRFLKKNSSKINQLVVCIMQGLLRCLLKFSEVELLILVLPASVESWLFVYLCWGQQCAITNYTDARDG